MFSGSRIAASKARGSYASPRTNQSQTWVSRSSFISPTLAIALDLVRERRVEVGRDRERIAQRSEPLRPEARLVDGLALGRERRTGPQKLHEVQELSLLLRGQGLRGFPYAIGD